MATYIDDLFIESNTSFKTLGDLLKEEFGSPKVHTPLRHHHDFQNPEAGPDSTLLLMPAWQAGNDLGVKIVTVSPENGKYDLPSIQGNYLYLDAQKGQVRALFDAKAITAKRTAATSALAASYLARKDADTLLVLGTGSLSANLIQAHAAYRPLKRVFVWGRNYEKAAELTQRLMKNSNPKGYEIKAISDYQSVLQEADIISTATLSTEPLIDGSLLRKGQHLDLVGSYKKNMREADDKCIERSTVFVDTFQGGLKESGDIVIPLEKGILKRSDVKADLFGLCSGGHPGRTREDEITLFKSVGHASEDLVAARYYYQMHERLRQDT